MITVFDNTPENDPTYMEIRIQELTNELKKKENKIHELKAYVFWHRNQEDKWKTKYNLQKIRVKELETKINLLTRNDN